MSDVMIGHLVLLVTTVIGFVFQWFDAERKHRWAKEEMNALRTEVRNGNHT